MPAYPQCGTPICALVGNLLKGAVTATGGTMTVVNAGSTAQTAQAAASTVLALKPDAVLLGAIDPALFGRTQGVVRFWASNWCPCRSTRT